MLPESVNLYVFTVLHDGRIIRAGRLLVENLYMAFRGGYKGVFQYDAEYLNHPDGYDLDPANLKRTTAPIPANRPEYGLHGVFLDSLPGKWGNHLLACKGGFHGQHYAPAHLLKALGGTGLGALLYSPHPKTPPRIEDPSLDFDHLAQALDEATLYEKEKFLPREIRFLVTSGYSAGGARPKLLVKKNDGYYLAKFASIHDPSPALGVELEAAGLELGRRIGLDIPYFEITRIGRRPVLLIKRFDMTPEGGRRAMLSFATLLVREPALGSYSGMAEIIRRYSKQPRLDLTRLFKQMVLNVAIHNTDDHLRNFSMVHDPDGWRLSPAYDMTPTFLQEEQATMVDRRTTKITTENIINQGKIFGFSRPKTVDILITIHRAIADWRTLITDQAAREHIAAKMAHIFEGITGTRQQ